MSDQGSVFVAERYYKCSKFRAWCSPTTEKDRNLAKIKQPCLFTVWLDCSFAEKRKRHSLIIVKVHIAFHCVPAGKPVLPGKLANTEKPRLLTGSALQPPPLLSMLSERLWLEELGVISGLPVVHTWTWTWLRLPGPLIAMTGKKKKINNLAP